MVGQQPPLPPSDPCPASCAAGKHRQVHPGPEGSRRTSTPAGSLAPPTATAARAPSCTLTSQSRSGHLSARPRDTHSHTTPGSVAAAADSGRYVRGDAAAGPPPRLQSAGVGVGERGPLRPERGRAEGTRRRASTGRQARTFPRAPGSASAAEASSSGGLRTCCDRRDLRADRMQNIPQPSSLLQTNSVSVDLSGRNAGQFRYLQTLSKLTGIDIFFKKKRFLPEEVPWVPSQVVLTLSLTSSDSSMASKVPGCEAF